MEAHQQDYRTSRTALVSMTQVCDVGYLLRDALQGQATPSNALLRAGIEGLGTSWQSAQTWLSTFSDRIHASATAARGLGWVPECGCWEYVSELVHASS